MTVWRWIETKTANGAFHMAADQALLENASTIQTPTLRVYSWKPACISLGIHQSIHDIDLDLCRRDNVDVVRRPSGGRGVFHHEEITYSVIFPRGSSMYLRSLTEIYDQINRGLLCGIRKLGVPAEIEKRSLDIRNHYQSKLSTSCFSAAAKYEIVIHGKKMVGSAQRKLPSGVLQHGSILIGHGNPVLTDYLKDVGSKGKAEMRRFLAGKSISIEEALDRNVTIEEVVAAIKQGMAEFFDFQYHEAGFTDMEKSRIGELMPQFSILSSGDDFS
jgi:lipoate-protein ligase A